MLTEKDLKQLAAKGITAEKLEQQLDEFKTGFPFLKLEGPAAIGNGILAPTADEVKAYVKAWNDYKAEGKKIVKFVPASGAASRMFKDMFAFVDAEYDTPTTDFEKKYFDNIEKFAFYDALDALLKQQKGKGIKELIAEGNYKAVAKGMLDADGLNYGQLPKGMLLFHKYEDGARTPMEEHLVEGALYAASAGEAFDYYQDVSGLPDGVYQLSANVFNSTNGEAGASVNGAVGLYAQTSDLLYFSPVTTDSEMDTNRKNQIDKIIVRDGMLRVGVRNLGPMTARWAGADNFVLSYLGTEAEVLTDRRSKRILFFHSPPSESLPYRPRLPSYGR